MRRTVELARDSGTSLVFLSANSVYWQVELGGVAVRRAGRLLTCRKRKGPGKPVLCVRSTAPSSSWSASSTRAGCPIRTR